METKKFQEQLGPTIDKAQFLEESQNKELVRIVNNLSENPNVEETEIENIFINFGNDFPEARESILNFKTRFNKGAIDGLQKIREKRKNLEKQNKNQELLNYFDINNESIIELNENLDLLGLDITQALEIFKNKLENDISFLPDEYKDKIRLSIKNTLSDLGDVFKKYKNECTDENGNLDEKEFKRNRWIINGKICDRFDFLSSELIPSIEFSEKYSQNKNIDISRFTRENLNYGKGEFEGNDYLFQMAERYDVPEIGIEKNPDYVDIDRHIKETKDVLNGGIEENGRFNKRLGFDFTDTFDLGKESQRELLELYGIEGTEISLLNEKDKQTESEAMMMFLISCIYQMIPCAGAIQSIGVDMIDLFTKNEGTILTLQQIGLVDKEFKMDKTWIDNIFGGIGLAGTAFGSQALGKTKKLSKLAQKISKIDPKVYELLVKTIKVGGDIDGKEMKSVYKLINKVANLSIEDKLKYSKIILKDLTPEKEQAIIKAHNIGVNKVFENTTDEIKEKIKILREGGFETEEMKLLLTNGVCGKSDKKGLLQLLGLKKGNKVEKSKDIVRINDSIITKKSEYLLDSIDKKLKLKNPESGLNNSEIKNILYDFNENFDINLFQENPNYIDDYIEIIENMEVYLNKNAEIIKNHGHLGEIKTSINNIRRNINVLIENNTLNREKNDILKSLKEDTLVSIFYKLN